MSGYVLVRGDGAYVAKPGSRGSYTRYLQDAHVFETEAHAEPNRCENERVVAVDSILWNRG